MAASRGANQAALGTFNTNVVLDLIRRSKDGISRADLARRTGLSAQTITNVARGLLEDGLLTEVRMQTGQRGQPPVLLRLRRRSRFAVGVHLDPAVVTFVLADLTGEVVARRQWRAAGDEPVPIAAVTDGIEELLASTGTDRAAVLGVGLAVPGPIDVAQGMLTHPPLLTGWHMVPLREEVERRTGFRVWMDKEVIAAATVPKFMGAEDRRNMVFVFFGSGIAAGLVLNGEVVRGVSGNAGDLAQLAPAGPPSLFDVTIASILARAQGEGVELDPGSVLQQFSEVVERAIKEEPVPQRLMLDLAQVTGRLIVGLVNLLDVDDVVIGGPLWDAARSFVLPVIEPMVNDPATRSSGHLVRISDGPVGSDIAAVGGACLAFAGALPAVPSRDLLL